MNAANLSKPEYQEQIKKELESFFALNLGTVSSEAIFGNAHKAYIRGLFLKLGAHEKRKRSEQINSFLQQIRQFELINKQNPDYSHT